jgi:hypothetical protein
MLSTGRSSPKLLHGAGRDVRRMGRRSEELTDRRGGRIHQREVVSDVISVR